VKHINGKKWAWGLLLGGAVALASGSVFAQTATLQPLTDAGPAPAPFHRLYITPPADTNVPDAGEDAARNKVSDASGNTWEAYVEDGKLSVRKSDGSTVGAPAFAQAGEAALILDESSGIPYVAYSDGANGFKISVMKFNGSGWEYVGTPGFSEGSVSKISVAMETNGSGNLAVFYSDSGSGAMAMKFDGTGWVVATEENTEDGLRPQMSSLACAIGVFVNGQPYYTMQYGSTGYGVCWVQQKLNACGYSTAVDGIFGWDTYWKVVYFQRSRGLAADGIVGPITRGALSRC